MIVKQNRKENAVLPNQTEVVKRLSELSRMLDAATDEIAALDDQSVRNKGYIYHSHQEEYDVEVCPCQQKKEIKDETN